ncbi:hypothetical protein Aduo_007124 [Ancylostoma duodenale]
MTAREKFLGFMTKYLKKNSSGYLVDDSLTWIDLLVAEHCPDILTKISESLDGFPEVKAHMERVHLIPKVRNQIEERPLTDALRIFICSEFLLLSR